MDNISFLLAQELQQNQHYIQNVIDLLDQGCTVPFIARYRKEMHGAMDDTTLRKLEDRLSYLRNLANRREEIKRAIEAQDKLTTELAAQIDAASTQTELEDLYRPYKQKRRTRATIAKEKGLQPLAEAIFDQQSDRTPLEQLAETFVNHEQGVESTSDALSGASDIIAEMISDDAHIRKLLRQALYNNGQLCVRAAVEEDSPYSTYYSFSQPIKKLHGHQVLAINRGEKEGFLKADIQLEKDAALLIMEKRLLKNTLSTSHREFLANTIKDSYERLILSSLENEQRSALTEEANEGAISTFALNLKPLLMQPPVKGAITMGLDPGYRNGCKVAVVDATGKVLDTAVVYLTMSEKQRNDGINKLEQLLRKHKVRHLAIGNGTASRETEQAVVELLSRNPESSYIIVNEAGASVYSASQLAADEFPNYDVNLRSAISIARRLQDPLAELVKIDPKAIGVGQYQHDMPQKRLSEALNGVVEDCVNAVGVDVNTASPTLLQHISGLNSTTAKNIVAYREDNGPFTNRKQLLKVPKLGPKSYEQCAGFLRVPDSPSVLDHTGVHPESYAATEKLLQLSNHTLDDVDGGKVQDLPARIKSYGESKAAQDCGIGVLTMQDIIKELLKPSRDPREELPPPIFRTDVLDIKDLKPGMILSGTVRNVVDFGVFVDIGVHQDGLVHISEISNRFLRHPSEMLSVGDVVKVSVLSADANKKRIALSIKQAN